MALSNLLNEPRREITEQLIGVVFIAVFLALDYYLAGFLHTKDFGDKMFAMVIVAVGLAFGLILLFPVVHAIGEIVCGVMASIGFDPRPKQRYRR